MRRVTAILELLGLIFFLVGQVMVIISLLDGDNTRLLLSGIGLCVVNMPIAVRAYWKD